MNCMPVPPLNHEMAPKYMALERGANLFTASEAIESTQAAAISWYIWLETLR
jgi:hypothetical protein